MDDSNENNNACECFCNENVSGISGDEGYVCSECMYWRVNVCQYMDF